MFEEMLAATLNLGGDTEKVTAEVVELLASEQEIVRYRAARRWPGSGGRRPWPSRS